MTVAEANVALRLNSLATAQIAANGDTCAGYVYGISKIHEEGKEPRIVVILAEDATGTLYQVRPEDVTVVDWRMPEYMIADAVEREEKRLAAAKET